MAAVLVVSDISATSAQPLRCKGMGTDLHNDVDAPGAYPVSPSYTFHDTRGVSHTPTSNDNEDNDAHDNSDGGRGVCDTPASNGNDVAGALRRC